MVAVRAPTVKTSVTWPVTLTRVSVRVITWDPDTFSAPTNPQMSTSGIVSRILSWNVGAADALPGRTAAALSATTVNSNARATGILTTSPPPSMPRRHPIGGHDQVGH